MRLRVVALALYLDDHDAAWGPIGVGDHRDQVGTMFQWSRFGQLRVNHRHRRVAGHFVSHQRQDIEQRRRRFAQHQDRRLVWEADVGHCRRFCIHGAIVQRPRKQSANGSCGLGRR